jgi:hypothetical protein
MLRNEKERERERERESVCVCVCGVCGVKRIEAQHVTGLQVNANWTVFCAAATLLSRKQIVASQSEAEQLRKERTARIEKERVDPAALEKLSGTHTSFV